MESLRMALHQVHIVNNELELGAYSGEKLEEDGLSDGGVSSIDRVNWVQGWELVAQPDNVVFHIILELVFEWTVVDRF